MAKFYVGQRVRVVASVWREYVGKETQIIGEDHDEWLLDLDPGDGFSGLWCAKAQAAHKLVPIQPSGQVPSDFKTIHDLLENIGAGTGFVTVRQNATQEP